MKKLLIIGGLAVVVLVGGLFAGAKIGADTDWTNEVLGSASKIISSAGFNKKEEILSRDLSEEVKSALDPKIAEEEAKLESMLEEYFQMKVNGMTDTVEYKELEKSIESIKAIIFDRYKKEIDLIFVE